MADHEPDSESEEAARLRPVHERLQPIVERLAESTVPICQKGPRGLPVPAGSGVLFRLQEQRFLITASHVFEPAIPDAPLYAIVNTHFVILSAPRRRTREGGGGRSEGRADLAIVTLGADQSDQWSHGTFLGASEVDPVIRDLDQAPTTGYLTIGYPNTLQPRILKAGEYQAVAHHFSTHRVDISEDNAVGARPELHLALGLDRRNFAGVPPVVELVHPRGMSGGGVWRIPNLLRAQPLFPQLVAIFIEYHAQEHLMLATWIGHVIAELANADPELKPALLAQYPDLFTDAA
jgi:hypothetical protein